MEHLRQPEQYPPSAYGPQLQSDDGSPAGPSEDYLPDDDDLSDLPEIDFDTFCAARREQDRQAASDDYGNETFEASEDANGRVIIKPLKRAETEAARSGMLHARSPESSGRVHEFLTKSRPRTKPTPDDGARPCRCDIVARQLTSNHKSYMVHNMSDQPSLRTHMIGLYLRDEERDLIDHDARDQGITRSEAMRRACPKYFAETGVKRGRILGVSPRRKSA